jgi:protease-4
VIDLKGQLVEQYTSSPLKRAFAEASNSDADRELQLRDLMQRCALAKDDDNIQRVVLLTDGFRVAGFAALRELGAALRDFRARGKQVSPTAA